MGESEEVTEVNSQSPPSGAWAALAVRPGEIEQVKRLIISSILVGLALVCFFSGSNALFLDRVGAETLPWVYIVNAPIVILAGFGYAAWSRRSSTANVLQGSIWVLTATVVLLWLWTLITDGSSAPFALAVWFRFLFIFGFLGLWEIASALFDVRQAKRLFPAVALGAMVAFMVGGLLVSGLTTFLDTVHLIALSAVFFTLYGVTFDKAMEGADFTAADNGGPATPVEILSDRFSRNLAFMRAITILLVFIGEFVFYEQVAANFSSDETIARFLGIFMATATLAMVICTAAVSGRYIARFGVGVGLISMPAGLAIIAVAMGLYGIVFGIDFGFFALAVFGNLANMVLANAIETPVGAVMYQPMPAERRMPVRVAVDGWLGSVALLLAGLLLLAFDRLDFTSVLPFVWLLAGVGLLGVWLARRLYGDYRQVLARATTVAFSGTGRTTGLLAELDEGRGRLHAGLVSDDPAAAFAVASLANEIDDTPLKLALPDLADSEDPAVAELAIEAMVAAGDPGSVARLGAIVTDMTRYGELRASALRGLLSIDAKAASTATGRLLTSTQTAGRDDLAAATMAVSVTESPTGTAGDRVRELAGSADAEDRRFAVSVLSATPAGTPLGPELNEVIADLIGDRNIEVRTAALNAARHRVNPALGRRLIALGHRPEHRRQAVEALATGGTTSVEVLGDVITTLPEAYVVDLVDHVYAQNTRRPVELHRFLEPTAPSLVRRAGFTAAHQADVNLPAAIGRLLRDDVAFTRDLLTTWRDANTRHGPAMPLLNEALIDEFDGARQAIWAGLRLAANSSRVREIEQLADTADDDTRANAMEVLDTLLNHETRQMVVPVLEPKNIDEAAETTVGLPPPQDKQTTLQGLCDNPRTRQSTKKLINHHLEMTMAEAAGAEQNAESNDMSETIERVIALKRVDIFSTLPYEVLTELGQVAAKRDVESGTTIITEGEFGDELFALTVGEVRVERDGETSAVLSAGTVFGELAVLDPGPRTATVVAEADCEMLVVNRPMLLALTDRRPEVMAEIARVLSVRLRNTQR